MLMNIIYLIIVYLELHLNLNIMVFYFLGLSKYKDYDYSNIFFCYFRTLIGKEEFPPSVSIEETTERKEKSKFFVLFHKYLERVKRWPIIQNRNHPVCAHKYHCSIHVLLV
jgi:hypothetical protein